MNHIGSQKGSGLFVTGGATGNSLKGLRFVKGRFIQIPLLQNPEPDPKEQIVLDDHVKKLDNYVKKLDNYVKKLDD